MDFPGLWTGGPVLFLFKSSDGLLGNFAAFVCPYRENFHRRSVFLYFNGISSQNPIVSGGVNDDSQVFQTLTGTLP